MSLRVRLIAVPLLAGIFLTPAGALAASSPTQAAGGTGIGVRLADAHGSYIVNRLAPGMTVRRRIEIENGTPSLANITVYAAGAQLSHRTFGFARSHVQNELSSWTSVNRRMLRLQPGAVAYETVTIAVPKGTSPGERYAVVWAEVSTPASAAGGVTLVNRVGVRMYLSIGAGGLPAPDFAIGPLHGARSAMGALLAVAHVKNNGGRTLDIQGRLTLTHGPGGLRAGPFPVTLSPGLAAGDSELARVRFEGHLPLGPWRAHLSLTSGFVHRDAVATITFPALAAAVTPSSSGHMLVLVGILVALLLLAAGIGAGVIRRRRHPRAAVLA